jgi:hypothetical protein
MKMTQYVVDKKSYISRESSMQQDNIEKRIVQGRSAEFNKNYENAVSSLERMQTFDTNSLPRTNDLGTAMNFAAAVEPANRLVDLYKQLPKEVLEFLSESKLSDVLRQANNDYNLFKQILDFRIEDGGSPAAERETKIEQIKHAYDPAFDRLFPIISYSVQKSTDFAILEREARASVQAVSDRGREIDETLKKHEEEAKEILTTIRKTAAEQGVSQQAIHFKMEADQHDADAKKWLSRTVTLTVVLGIYALLTLWIHKLPNLAPTNSYEAIQLAVSKILIFGTLSFLVFLSARNFTAHRHNCVVNRHRQNALVTYRSLVDAASTEANRDIVLTKASECIFAAQATAFSKLDSNDGSYSIVNLSPSAFKASSST